MRIYQGDCVTILEDELLFSDATEMAQVVENAVKINENHFVSGIEGRGGLHEIIGADCTFFRTENSRIYIAYNDVRDIHYFFS